MKICFVAFSPGTTLRVRGHGFAKYLRKNGFETEVLTFFQAIPSAQKSLSSRATDRFTSHMALFKRILSCRPDIIYLLKPSPPAAFPALLGKKVLGCRFVFDTDDWELGYRPPSGNPMSLLESSVVGPLEKYLSTHSDLVVTASAALEAHVFKLGAPKGRVHYCPTGVDTDVFDPGKFTKETRKGRTIVYTGKRVDVGYEHEAVVEMLKALKLVVKEHGDAKLLMTGKGDPALDSKIKSFLRQENMEKHVVFTGFLPEKDLVKTLAQADVALLPFADNILNRYKSPTNLFEYMAMGLPAVAGRVGEVKAVIQERENGMLYEPGNSEDFAEKIIHLLKEKELAEKIGKAARKTVEERYSLEILMSHLAKRLSSLG